MIFQDPFACLHPDASRGRSDRRSSHRTVKVSNSDANKRAVELLDAVGIPNAEEPGSRLPTSVLGWDAPTRHDRDGPRAQPVGPDRGRADDRPRRHRAGADSRAHRAGQTGLRHRRHSHHPRSRGDRRDGRHRARHVRRTRHGATGPRASSSARHRTPTHGACSARCRRSSVRLEKLIAIEGIAAVDGRRAAGLRIQPPLSVPLRPLHARAARAAADSGRAPRSLPSLRPEQARDLGGELSRRDSVRRDEHRRPNLSSSSRTSRSTFRSARASSRVASARVHAVEDVSLTVHKGETLGIVGESGCGKSTTARLMLRLLDPTAGTIRFEGRDIYAPLASPAPAASARDADDLPGSVRVAQSAQDRRADRRPAVRRSQRSRAHARRRLRVKELLDVVGLSREHASRYPHEFSGGQRQRIGIARALALNPKLIVCDEPVSALDVSVQAQILNLLRALQRSSTSRTCSSRTTCP